jgi:hypothetical protein
MLKLEKINEYASDNTEKRPTMHFINLSTVVDSP